MKKWRVTEVKDEKQPKAENAVRVLLFSDTHGRTREMTPYEYEGIDISIFSGDFTNIGGYRDIVQFKDWYLSCKSKYKVMISGNHELTLDLENQGKIRPTKPELLEGKTPQELKNVLLNEPGIIYLENRSINLCGLNIFGSPYSPYFCNWAFPTPEDPNIWDMIPQDTDIIVTHGGPLGILDKSVKGIHCGCPRLDNAILKIKPALCVFGHIHEDAGLVVKKGITYVNASVLNYHYEVAFKPRIVDFTPKPEKSDCTI